MRFRKVWFEYKRANIDDECEELEYQYFVEK